MLGRGKFPPLPLLSSCGWTNHKIDTRQINRRKRNKLFYFIFKINFYWSIVALQCCISFLLYSKVSQSYIYIYPLFFSFPSHLVTTEHGVEFPVLYSRFSLVIYFIHSSIYMSVPISPFIPLPFPPLVTISLFSTSVTLFLLCK